MSSEDESGKSRYMVGGFTNESSTRKAGSGVNEIKAPTRTYKAGRPVVISPRRRYCRYFTAIKKISNEITCR